MIAQVTAVASALDLRTPKSAGTIGFDKIWLASQQTGSALPSAVGPAIAIADPSLAGAAGPAPTAVAAIGPQADAGTAPILPKPQSALPSPDPAVGGADDLATLHDVIAAMAGRTVATPTETARVGQPGKPVPASGGEPPCVPVPASGAEPPSPERSPNGQEPLQPEGTLPTGTHENQGIETAKRPPSQVPGEATAALPTAENPEAPLRSPAIPQTADADTAEPPRDQLGRAIPQRPRTDGQSVSAPASQAFSPSALPAEPQADAPPPPLPRFSPVIRAAEPAAAGEPGPAVSPARPLDGRAPVASSADTSAPEQKAADAPGVAEKETGKAKAPKARRHDTPDPTSVQPGAEASSKSSVDPILQQGLVASPTGQERAGDPIAVAVQSRGGAPLPPTAPASGTEPDMAPAADGNADRGKPRPVSLAALGERLRPMEGPDDKSGKMTIDRGAVVFSLDAAASAAPPARDAVAAANPQVARHDPVVTHHLDLAGDSAWLDQLSRDIASSASADGHLRFTLAPEHLGRLEVQMAAGADGTAVRLTTESHEAHRIISDAQPQLMAEARAQGLRISEAHVELNNRSGGSAGHQAFGNQNSGGRPQPQRLNSAAETPARAGASPTEVGATDALYA